MFYHAGFAQDAPPSPDAPSETAALSTFPYCVCDQYKCNMGPYRLNYVGRTETLTNVELCFKLEVVRT